MSLFDMLTSNDVFAEKEISVESYDSKWINDPNVIYKSPGIVSRGYCSLDILNSTEDCNQFIDYIGKFGYRLKEKNRSMYGSRSYVIPVSYPFVKQMQILLLRGKLDDCLVYKDVSDRGIEIILMPCYCSSKWIILPE